MRILLTGHKGYIGTVMVPMLLADGHELVGLDSDLYRSCTFGDQPIVDIPEIEKDIRDTSRTDLEGFDAVIHLAALSNDPLGFLNPQLTAEINFEASVHLARLAKQAGVSRYVYSSSCSVYGASGDDFIDESAEFRPVTPYGVSKVDVEREVSKLAGDNFSPVYMRNATAYGLSPRIRFDLVLNNLVAWAYTTGRVYIKSDGTPWRPIVHIEDISRAFLAALRAPLEIVHNEAFNIGSTEENYRVRELADIVKETVPGCHIDYAADGGPDKRCYRVSCDKAARLLPDARPQWTARKGAQQMYEAFRKVALSVDDFEGDRYSRIAHVRKLLSTGQLQADLRWSSAIHDDTNDYARVGA